ncbi:MAG: hypothetical protein O7G85_08800 [Planctomycetota bacterium]|nr:hypothetical protein [Planctomycetota bacterium]
MKTNMFTVVMVGVVMMLLPIASVTQGDVLKDNFNDGQRSSIWKIIKQGTKVKIREKHGHLESKSIEPGGGSFGKGYVSKGWKFKFTKDYKIKFKYHLDVLATNGNRETNVGIVVFPSGPVEYVSIGVSQVASGRYLYFEVFQGGNVIDYEEVFVPNATGTIKVKYNASKDRLDIFLDGVRKLRIRHLLQGVDTGNGTAELAIGADRLGFVEWRWREAWLDDFVIRGRIID